MEKMTLTLCLVKLNCDSKSRLQLFINANILWEQMDKVQSENVSPKHLAITSCNLFQFFFYHNKLCRIKQDKV